MAAHVTDPELLDVVEGTAGPGLRSHVEGCSLCRSRAEAALSGAALAREAEVPEPPPLYWEAFRRRVGRRIQGEERAAVPLWPRLLALAAVLLAAVGVLPRRAIPTHDEKTLPAWTALPPSDEDGGLQVLRAVASAPEDLAGAGGCQEAVPDCLASLSEEESRVLADDLRRDLGAGSL